MHSIWYTKNCSKQFNNINVRRNPSMKSIWTGMNNNTTFDDNNGVNLTCLNTEDDWA